jgi:hypothetical protein
VGLKNVGSKVLGGLDIEDGIKGFWKREEYRGRAVKQRARGYFKKV